MGHTNSTVNYNLPQFVGTDKPSWLGDVNNAFLAIDAAIAAAKTEADSAAGGVAGLQTTVGSHTTQIGTLTEAVTAQGGTLNSVTALIGNGTPTTTDQTIIGAINELHADQGDLTALTTTDKSSIVKAVNELNADIITIEHGTLTPTLSAGFNNVTIAYSKDYVGYYVLPSIVLNNAEAGQNQQIRIVGLTERGTNGCKWKIFIDPEYVQYLSSPVFEWTALCQHL